MSPGEFRQISERSTLSRSRNILPQTVIICYLKEPVRQGPGNLHNYSLSFITPVTITLKLKMLADKYVSFSMSF